jgi:peptide/nickel transport system substrate-binding protein
VRASTWCAPWPSGFAMLPPQLSSLALARYGQPTNVAAVSSRFVDGRIREIPLLPLEEQAAAWNDLDKRVETSGFPVIAAGYGGVGMMRGSRVQGLAVDTVSGMPTWKDLWLGPG